MARAASGLIALAACASAPGKEEAGALFAEAEALYAKGEYSEAIEKYSESIQVNSGSAEAHYKRGRSRLELIDKAAPSEADGDAPATTYLQANAEALADFDAAIRLLPEYFEAYLARSAVYASQARYKDAAYDLLYFCLKIRPKDLKANLMLAKVYDVGFQDKHQEALKYYLKYLELGGSDRAVRERILELQAPSAQAAPGDEKEKKATELFAHASALLKSGARSEALRAFLELVQNYADTAIVKENASGLRRTIELLTPPKVEKKK